MRRSLRRELQLLRTYVLVSSITLVIIAVSAFSQPEKPGNMGEITAERLNIVDANGTLRLVISNKDRMHPGVIGGKTINRVRPVAGLLFFNEDGDEVGGLTFTGREQNGAARASAGIMFDQFRQDQTIGFDYSDDNGRRTAAFKVWDRPDSPLGDLVDKLNAANAIQNPAEREAALRQIRATAPPVAQRVFVGKDRDRTASVLLADAQGRNRLALRVDAEGRASIEFLDADGKVVQRLAPDR